MKTALTILFFAGSLLAGPLQIGDAGFPKHAVSASGGGGGCTKNSNTGTSSGEENFGDGGNSSNGGIAFQWTPDCSGTVSPVILYMAFPSGAAGYLMTSHIYTDSGGHPGTEIGTGSGSINENTVGTSEVPITFTGMSCSYTSGTTYWVVLLVSDYFSGDPGNLFYTSDAGTIKTFNGLSTWTSAANHLPKYQIP